MRNVVAARYSRIASSWWNYVLYRSTVVGLEPDDSHIDAKLKSGSVNRSIKESIYFELNLHINIDVFYFKYW